MLVASYNRVEKQQLRQFTDPPGYRNISSVFFAFAVIFAYCKHILCFLYCVTILQNKIYITHTHTHPFNGPFSGTTQVSWYQKGKTNLDFTETRDSEWKWHQLGHMQVCTSPAPHHSSFYRPDALPAAQPTASKHCKQKIYIRQIRSI